MLPPFISLVLVLSLPQYEVRFEAVTPSTNLHVPTLPVLFPAALVHVDFCLPSGLLYPTQISFFVHGFAAS
jgi:hypothetical protein